MAAWYKGTICDPHLASPGSNLGAVSSNKHQTFLLSRNKMFQADILGGDMGALGLWGIGALVRGGLCPKVLVTPIS